ncbi:MAG TPA: hypothetical protein VGM82_00215 [Gemmatimonadaceae bacterium]|jgi:hypothetical protein
MRLASNVATVLVVVARLGEAQPIVPQNPVQGAAMSNGQTKQKCGYSERPWSDRLQVRQSFDRKLASAPASFSYSIAPGVPRSIAIAAAARLNLHTPDRIEFGPTIEAAINTAVSKKQDVEKAGFTAAIQAWPYLDGGPDCPARHSWSPIFDAAVAWQRDGVNQTNGVGDHLTFTTIQRSTTHAFWSVIVPNNPANWGRSQVTWAPYAGAEHQTDVDSARAKTALRGLLSLNFDVLPLRKLNDVFDVLVTSEYRKDWARSNIGGDGWNRWFTVGATYQLLKSDKHAAGIGLSYAKGANPTQGFDHQELTQIILKFQW